MIAPSLWFDTVACARGDRMLFRDLSFAIPAGGAALVTGPNGAGKSSLIRIAAGLLSPVAGIVVCEGRAALQTAETAALDPELPVARALQFWAAIDGAPRTAAEAALADVGLAELADIPVRLLSTGQRRRIAFARVIAARAPIWLLDEPANGLDDSARGVLERHVRHHRDGGGIALIATHLPIALPDAMPIRLGMEE